MNKRILAIDDSKMVRQLMEFMVSAAGYEVDTAGNGAAALERLARVTYDLALVDLNMPVMDGYTLIARIREQAALDDLAIIIVTTESEARDRQRGIEAGADLTLVKPVDEGDLIATIRMLIGDPNG